MTGQNRAERERMGRGQHERVELKKKSKRQGGSQGAWEEGRGGNSKAEGTQGRSRGGEGRACNLAHRPPTASCVPAFTPPVLPMQLASPPHAQEEELEEDHPHPPHARLLASSHAISNTLPLWRSHPLLPSCHCLSLPSTLSFPLLSYSSFLPSPS